MLNDYGIEVVSIIESGLVNLEQARLPGRYGSPVGEIVDNALAAISPGSGAILYFAPGRYVLDGPPGRVYVIPEHVQLYFAVGAILRVADGVILNILGSIRAGMQQIFGFTRDESREFIRPGRLLAAHPEVITWPLYVGAGKVVIESAVMPLVRPEWWGAKPFNNLSLGAPPTAPLADFDSSDALRAAIEVARAASGEHARGAPRRAPSHKTSSVNSIRTVPARVPSWTAYPPAPGLGFEVLGMAW